MAGFLLRLITLSLLFAWSVIGAAVGLNSLVKSNHQKKYLKSAAPQGVDVNINTNDVFDTGVIISVICLILAILSLLGLCCTHPRVRASKAHTPRVLGGTIAFFAVFLFATLIAFDHFFATRSAQVTATLAGFALPASIIAQDQQALGVTSVYKHISYLRLLAILPWFTFLFAVLSAIELLRTARRAEDAGVGRTTDEKARTENVA